MDHAHLDYLTGRTYVDYRDDTLPATASTVTTSTLRGAIDKSERMVVAESGQPDLTLGALGDWLGATECS